MSPVTTPSVVRQIRALFDGSSVTGLTDGQLIERFNDRRDATGEAAFSALVTRHGPMVLRVCRHLLNDQHHAEDAFQAVFLVLARRSRSIRDPNLLGNWLYGVALRTARKARGRLARHYKNEISGFMRYPGSDSGVPVERMVPPAEQWVLAREQAEVLHREIARLPRPFRLPIVLCYLEGLTLDEAAHRLQCPAGTVRSRLARACDKLRRGLRRRGVALPATAITTALASRSASASISSSLCDTTTKAALQFAVQQTASGALSASAMALAQEVLRSILIHKLKLTMLTLLFLGAVASGAGFAGLEMVRQAGKPDLHQIAAAPDDANKKPAPGRMFVLGRVLDPTGNPVPNAAIMVSARSKALGHSPSLSRMSPIPVGNTRADGSGRFHLDAPRTSSSRYDTLAVLAIAPGYGVGWVELDPDADQPAVDITLRPEHVVQGRLFDVQGRPVAGATISVWSIRHELPQALAPPRGRFEGISYYWTNTNDFSAWPKPAVTDAEGRFTLRGVGRNLHVFLTVHHPQFALQRIEVETDGTSESKPITMALEPAKVITGRVTFADTGKPVPHALLGVLSSREGFGGSLQSDFETDAEGQFRINPPSGDRYNISAWPPAGQSYLTMRQRLDWPKGAVEQSLNLALPRGVSIHGTVTEEGSGQPVAAATVRFIAHAERQGNVLLSSGSTVLDTAADGSFQFGALPSPGYLSIMAPSDDYVYQAIGSRMTDEGQPGGRRYYSHANMLLDLKPGSGTKEVHITLHRGMTVKGQVVGPDGQSVPDAWVISRIIMQPTPGVWKIWRGDYHGNVRDGHFDVHGLDPNAMVPVHFLDSKRKLGTTVRFSRNAVATGLVTVRLERCGLARARFVNLDGKPFVGRLPRRTITMVVTSGAPDTLANERAGLLAADEAELNQIDPTNYTKPLASDADGRLLLPILIPGATYRFTDRTTVRDASGPQVRKEFTVKPGEALDLGDILIEKPQR